MNSFDNGVIFKRIHDDPVGLCWEMISLGTQGQVKPED